MWCYDMSCYVMWCYVMLFYVMYVLYIYIYQYDWMYSIPGCMTCIYIYMYIVIHCNNICNYTSIPAGLSPSNDFDTTAVPPQCRVNFVDEQGLMFFFSNFWWLWSGCGNPSTVLLPKTSRTFARLFAPQSVGRHSPASFRGSLSWVMNFPTPLLASHVLPSCKPKVQHKLPIAQRLQGVGAGASPGLKQRAVGLSCKPWGSMGILEAKKSEFSTANGYSTSTCNLSLSLYLHHLHHLYSISSQSSSSPPYRPFNYCPAPFHTLPLTALI